MPNIFFTADQHFGHANIIKYCNRGFRSVDEMDQALIAAWNRTVGHDDVVYQLGDFTLRCKAEAQKYFYQLNGTIYVIPGSHDQKWFPTNRGTGTYYSRSGHPVEPLPPLHTLQLEQGDTQPLLIVLCHYAMRVWDRSHYGSFHVFGHSHGELPGIGRSMDVGVDAVGPGPIMVEDILKRLKHREITRHHSMES